jgi:hypothetical protein
VRERDKQLSTFSHIGRRKTYNVFFLQRKDRRMSGQYSTGSAKKSSRATEQESHLSRIKTDVRGLRKSDITSRYEQLLRYQKAIRKFLLKVVPGTDSEVVADGVLAKLLAGAYQQGKGSVWYSDNGLNVEKLDIHVLAEQRLPPSCPSLVF